MDFIKAGLIAASTLALSACVVAPYPPAYRVAYTAAPAAPAPAVPEGQEIQADINPPVYYPAYPAYPAYYPYYPYYGAWGVGVGLGWSGAYWGGRPYNGGYQRGPGYWGPAGGGSYRAPGGGGGSRH